MQMMVWVTGDVSNCASLQKCVQAGEKKRATSPLNLHKDIAHKINRENTEACRCTIQEAGRAKTDL